MAIYYMRADGSATKVNAVGPETNSTACMNMTTHNAATFDPGDTIICSGLGGIYRGYFRPPSSGSDGLLITYLGSNSPHFTAKNLATGWTNHSGSVWKCTWAAGGDITAQHLFIDGVDKGVGQASLVAVDSEGEWYLDDPGNILYLYNSAGDPDNYSNPGVEVNSGSNVIDMNRSYIIVDGLHFSWGSYAQLRSSAPGSHVVVRNCLTEYGMRGLSTTTAGASSYTDWEIYDNEFRYHWNCGVEFLRGGRESRIYRNRIHDIDKGAYHIDSQYTNGIKVWDDSALTGSVEVFENLVYDCGAGGAHPAGQPAAIWFDHVQTDAGDECVAYHNKIYNCTGTGIFIEISKHCQAYSNLIYNCATNTTGTEEYTPAGIRVDTRESFNGDYNKVYNNTIVGGRCGILVAGYYNHTGTLSYNEVKNNIAVGWTEYGLLCRNGGDNTSTHGVGVGNVYLNNCFGLESSDSMFQWNYHKVGIYDGIEALAATANQIVVQDTWLDNTSQPIDGTGGYWWGIEVPLSGTGTVNLKRIFARLYRVGTPSNSTARVRIYNDSSGAPGTSIAEATLNISSVTTDSVNGEWYEFVFSSSVVLTKGNTYYFVILGDWAHDNNNCIKIFGRTSGYTGTCHNWRYSGTWAETTTATSAFMALDDAYVPGWMNNVEVAPGFFDELNNQYWPADDSPCLGAGVNLGSEYRLALHPNSTWPDGVVTCAQGSNWNLGAYAIESAAHFPSRPFRQGVYFPSSMIWIGGA